MAEVMRPKSCSCTFRERCDEFEELILEDGAEKNFFNCTCKRKDLPEEIRKFYDYVIRGTAGSTLTKRIDDAVAKARKNEIWRSAYMKEQILFMDAKEEGREEERRNTEKERRNAEKERKNVERERVRAEMVEARVKELEAKLAAVTA